MHVHLIGVCGTGMGSLAGLLRSCGHRVTGSDLSFYPPMSDALVRWGIETRQGFDPSHLQPRPDLVVVGNVCRANNPEARAAIDRGMRYLSFPAVLEDMFLKGRQSFVAAGTHGKTTTTAILAYLLDAAGKEPGFLIGGIPEDFDESFRVALPGRPFVIEGDEYDSAFFEKTPKFWRYAPQVALITAVEHDHVDIYPDMSAYCSAFVEFVARIPEHGILVAFAGDPQVRAVVRGARCGLEVFALQGDDCADFEPNWVAIPCPAQGRLQPFDLFHQGSPSPGFDADETCSPNEPSDGGRKPEPSKGQTSVYCGRFASPLPGDHNLRNAVAALVMAHRGAGVPLQELGRALAGFGGVRRRQQLRGVQDGVRVYDDFAHHPTAVVHTLRALRALHPEGKLIAIFEPRSATASRRMHQDVYPIAFGPADLTLLAPVGRPEIPEQEKLDVALIARQIGEGRGQAFALPNLEAIIDRVVEVAQPGDTVVAMSNGAFGNIHQRLLNELASRSRSERQQKA